MKNELKTPGVVNWIGYLAITLLVILPLAVLTVRAGAWQQGLMLYAIGCLGALLLTALSLVLLLLPRFAPWRKAIAARAAFALPGTILFLALLGSGGDIPPIHDISTDTLDPPVFTVAPQRRGATANSLETAPETLALQREAYPDLQTMVTPLPIDEAFDAALQLAGDMGWEVYHQDRYAGLIEAVDTTAIMAFRDDIVIRVRSNAAGTLVDLRSVSRVGVSDMGANAQRIRDFQQRFGR